MVERYISYLSASASTLQVRVIPVGLTGVAVSPDGVAGGFGYVVDDVMEE